MAACGVDAARCKDINCNGGHDLSDLAPEDLFDESSLEDAFIYASADLFSLYSAGSDYISVVSVMTLDAEDSPRCPVCDMNLEVRRNPVLDDIDRVTAHSLTLSSALPLRTTSPSPRFSCTCRSPSASKRKWTSGAITSRRLLPVYVLVSNHGMKGTTIQLCSRWKMRHWKMRHGKLRKWNMRKSSTPEKSSTP